MDILKMEQTEFQSLDLYTLPYMLLMVAKIYWGNNKYRVLFEKNNGHIGYMWKLNFSHAVWIIFLVGLNKELIVIIV